MFDNQIKSTPLTITAFASPLFSLPLGEDEVKWTVRLSKENIWKRFSTLSQIAVLEGEALLVSANFVSQCLLSNLLPDKHLARGSIKLAAHFSTAIQGGITYQAWLPMPGLMCLLLVIKNAVQTVVLANSNLGFESIPILTLHHNHLFQSSR